MAIGSDIDTVIVTVFGALLDFEEQRSNPPLAWGALVFIAVLAIAAWWWF